MVANNNAVTDTPLLPGKQGKIHNFSTESLTALFREKQASKQTVGLIGGCFDVLHMGHIDMFRFAKSKVDFLCVILDNDASIRASKGEQCPLFDEITRAEQMAELESVDCVAVWNVFMPAGSDKTDDIWKNLLRDTHPDFHITNIEADSFWPKKQELCEQLDIGFIGYQRSRVSSSTLIREKMLENVELRN